MSGQSDDRWHCHHCDDDHYSHQHKECPFGDLQEGAGGPDPVNSPSHYNTGTIEVIDFIEDQKLAYHEGNVVKYVSRAKHKGRELEDLKKAAWYLNRRIEQLEAK